MALAEAFSLATKRSGPWRARLGVLGICLAVVALFWRPVTKALLLSYQDDRYIQILVAPLICLYLIYWDHENVFAKADYSPRLGARLLSGAVLLSILAFAAKQTWHAGEIVGLIPVLVALVAVCQASFVFCFGTKSFRAALYAFCCLWLTIPIPPAVIDKLTAAYQHGSAAISFGILSVAGVSVLQDGTTFSIPGLDFRVAPECSGIRSGLAFLLVGILAARLFLRSGWSRLFLILSTIPITMFKNAIRIVVTTSLGAYVDRSFIDGPFHHQYGGIIFSPLDFLLFVPLVMGLRKLESRTPAAEPMAAESATALVE